MRIAVVSDIHGNLTALEAVLSDLAQTAPDLILHGGDLADGGASPVEVVDRVRELGWQGVVGNTDQMLFDPRTLIDFAIQSPKLRPIFDAVEEMAVITRQRLGQERLSWLASLPTVLTIGPVALVHASPQTPWRGPNPQASDAELEETFDSLGCPIVVYGHIHQPYVRKVSRMTIANTGSISLSYDGDPRASYLLIDDNQPTIRRVDYDVDKEIRALCGCGFPHSDWVAKILTSATPQMP